MDSGGSWATLRPALLLARLMGVIMLAGQWLGVLIGSVPPSKVSWLAMMSPRSMLAHRELGRINRDSPAAA